MRRIVISVLIGLAIGALGASPALAAPSLLPGGTYAYTDHRPLVDPIFGSGATGFGVTVGAQVFDGIDNGVDNLVARTVTPSNAGFPGGTGPYPLSFIYWISAGDEAEWGDHFQLGVGDLGNVTGTYHFYFEDNLGGTLDVYSHPLNSGNLRQLAMPEDITFTGPALTPTVSWTDPNGSAVFGGNEFHNYRLRIFNATTGQYIYSSSTSSSPSITVSSGILSFGESYWFRPEILDLDDEDNSSATTNDRFIENRSIAYAAYTPIPEPGTLLLLGSGLLGAAVWRRKRGEVKR